jgi:hypothetical protein
MLRKTHLRSAGKGRGQEPRRSYVPVSPKERDMAAHTGNSRKVAVNPHRYHPLPE